VITQRYATRRPPPKRGPLADRYFFLVCLFPFLISFRSSSLIQSVDTPVPAQSHMIDRVLHVHASTRGGCGPLGFMRTVTRLLFAMP
jgi:hypothetical protein